MQYTECPDNYTHSKNMFSSSLSPSSTSDRPFTYILSNLILTINLGNQRVPSSCSLLHYLIIEDTNKVMLIEFESETNYSLFLATYKLIQNSIIFAFGVILVPLLPETTFTIPSNSFENASLHNWQNYCLVFMFFHWLQPLFKLRLLLQLLSARLWHFSSPCFCLYGTWPVFSDCSHLLHPYVSRYNFLVFLVEATF